MDIFECYDAEYSLSLKKLDHIWESAFDSFMINCNVIDLSPVIEESVKDLMYQESASDLGKKVVSVIQAIIDTVKEFCSKMKDAIIEKFSGKEAKDKLKKLDEAIKDDPSAGSQKVKISSDQKAKAALDKYIQEMAKLERKLMNIKLQSTKYFKFGNERDASLIISANEIMRDMDKLNESYDKQFLQENDEVIEMALKDAIRFSDKQLDNIKVDYAEVEKASERVLSEFKKDASGCDVPAKYNMIQKMANAIGTRVRKFVKKRTEVKKKNLALIFATAAAALGIGAFTQYHSNPAVKQSVDALAKEVGADKVMKKVKDKFQDLAAKGAES